MGLLCTLAVAVGVPAFVAALIGYHRTSAAALPGSALAASSSAGGLIGLGGLLHELLQLDRCSIQSIQVPALSGVYQLDHFAPVLLQQFLFACLAH